MIAVDVETIESPNFKKLGPGYHRKDAAILCVGLYDGRDFECVEISDPRLKDWLGSNEAKVFHNSVYDVTWFEQGYNIRVRGVLHDTMTRAALIDEHADAFDLDSCCKREQVAGKNYSDTLEVWFEVYKERYGLKGTVWQNLDVLWMHKEGRDAIIRYNKQDCIATYNLWYAQERKFSLHQEAYQLECDLQPVIQLLNGTGFPVNEVARDSFTVEVEHMLKEKEEEATHLYNITRETVSSPKQLTKAMHALGLRSSVPTATGGDSWSADALAEMDHPVAEVILEMKKYITLLNNFLEGSLQKLVNGRAYSVFSPNKRDEGGTRTGRFASKTINLQQIPAREESAQGIKSYGKEMREMFIGEPGYLVGSIDYSSIEMYGLAHESLGPRSDVFRDQARARMDFHKMAMELSGLEKRVWAKRLNFTIVYGAGPRGIFAKNKKDFGTLENTVEIYKKYHAGMPFVKATCDAIMNEARTRGYVVSIGGRVHHKPKPYYDPDLGRYNTGLYKMPNYKIQGLCSDTIKRGLVDGYEAGVFDYLKLYATVHDENVIGIPYTKAGIEAAIEFQQYMENAFKDRWTVPIFTSATAGKSWGYDEEDVWNAMKAGSFDFDKWRDHVC